ncbi:MAG TPA: 30S ribosomal protein S17 [Deltaproteobacteria bacterium]|nr:30S ribosomal protein S17 [Deltaproteobacteria bacterium]
MEVKGKEYGKKMAGVVVKNAMEKTVVVEVEKFLQHPKYHKFLKMKKRYKAHDEKNLCDVGDRVVIVEVRPISKEKGWLVKEVVKKAEPVVEFKDIDEVSEIKETSEPVEEVIKDDSGTN